MVLSRIWCGFMIVCLFFSVVTGTPEKVTASLIDGAANGIRVTISIAGPLCLWAGIGNLIQKVGIGGWLAKRLAPVMGRLYPSSSADPILAQSLSANFCANLLGLGNAATPMGIQAARRLVDPSAPHIATDELCRLVVCNTASVQLLPTTVAALRQSAGCAAPFDLLPCVWVTSCLSICAGLSAAWLMKRWWNHV